LTHGSGDPADQKKGGLKTHRFQAAWWLTLAIEGD
jgi:hypothetical protein